jgi:ABC-type dipeptide/oligopeptide/nickel transport system permease component
MSKIIGRRLLSLIFVIFSLTFLTFIVGYLAPGDLISAVMGTRRDPAAYERLRHVYGLDQPWPQQCLNYITGLLSGDLGKPYKYQERAVTDILGSGIGVSVKLGGVALLLSLLIGVPAGIFSALRQDTWLDRGNMALMLILFSIPTFVINAK